MTRLTIAVLLAAAVFAGVFVLVHGGHADHVDADAFRLIGGSRTDLLGRSARALSLVGPALLGLATLTALFVLVRRRAWPEAGTIVGGFPLALVAARIAKAAEQRPRPHGGLLHAAGYAFPSTDSALAVGALVVAVAVARGMPAGGPRRFLVAAGVALAGGAGLLFIALRVHYLSDVVAGWALGVVVFGTLAIVLTRLAPSSAGL